MKCCPDVAGRFRLLQRWDAVARQPLSGGQCQSNDTLLPAGALRRAPACGLGFSSVGGQLVLPLAHWRCPTTPPSAPDDPVAHSRWCRTGGRTKARIACPCPDPLLAARAAVTDALTVGGALCPRARPWQSDSTHLALLLAHGSPFASRASCGPRAECRGSGEGQQRGSAIEREVIVPAGAMSITRLCQERSGR